MIIIKKIVWALCLLYTINVIIGAVGKSIPINIYTIIITAILDIPAILGFIFLKYYI